MQEFHISVCCSGSVRILCCVEWKRADMQHAEALVFIQKKWRRRAASACSGGGNSPVAVVISLVERRRVTTSGIAALKMIKFHFNHDRQFRLKHLIGTGDDHKLRPLLF